MVKMGGLAPRPLTCEVILGQKTLRRKRPAKGAKPYSHRGLPAFRISRSFREFPCFSARMVVKARQTVDRFDWLGKSHTKTRLRALGDCQSC